ncbi:protein TolR [Rhodospirillum rubrum]|uniref:Biopolymer transport protein ExbD/TolR n=1 Tax=Rhodospirillum rubrum (strain ATCC 11170 / ATH 1.1.1 / DSM 467 / LMG 4362 / NCIMB 8255 / S1) TaxID=269796 RepID=Q2RVF2_RHORT|nr:protein TolR [Rhodospirillum rubrum]ABC21893.1 Biopolymer transport protein ExbD/TolR [Rhodospirillum rubrum ATCC 11170]AEO47595.1 biopolymer transport protein ExbD/TolR [Rhodospirillum rubrum F11]MBK5953456.1 protein TolR [Rhodospirillum rubrum]QXG81552.1 protein TolR [Rhodospirillum rubrum]HCF17726.1 protein TolR [Rhodospirillum rubrum]
MGASVQPRRGGRRKRSHQMSDINVTPMVDVMLVLLIIFMVTAPLLTTGVKVDLPRTSAPSLDQDNQSLTVSVGADGTLYVQDKVTDESELMARMQAITGVNPEARIYVRGDAGINYGRVMEVMGILRSAGYTKVALVTQPGAPGAAQAKPAATAPAAKAPAAKPKN